MSKGRHPRREGACSACGQTKPIEAHGWCSGCYQRWYKAGKPESGPPLRTFGRVRPEEPQPCSSCNKTREVYYRTWCHTCYARWRNAGRPESGPPVPWANRKPRVRACVKCARVEKIHTADGLCKMCYQRCYLSSHPSGVVKNPRQAERLNNLRIAWILANPEKNDNPYECMITECHTTADPGLDYLCQKHFRRISKTGRYDRDPCKRCGKELNGARKAYLCVECQQEGWRYCAYIEHEGDKILPVSDMRSATRGKYNTATLCKECSRKESIARDRAVGVKPRDQYFAELAKKPHGTVAAYNRHRYHNEVPCDSCSEASRNRNKDKTPEICKSCGKTGIIKAHDWCSACYNRWLKTERPESGPPPAASKHEAMLKAWTTRRARNRETETQMAAMTLANETELQAYVQHLIAEAPPLSPEKLARLASLLSSGDEPDAHPAENKEDRQD